MVDYVVVKKIDWIPGIRCFKVIKTNVPHMQGKRYTVNDLHVIRSLKPLKIKRDRRSS